MSRITSLIDNIPLGKYKGKTVDHVLIVDPMYMKWFVENVDSVEFSDNMKIKIGMRVSDKHNFELEDSQGYDESEDSELQPLSF